MRLIKTTLIFLLFSLSINTFGQKPTDVLVTINDSIYNVADFERLYTKNIDIIADESQKDIDNYFNLYKIYKLRLQNAYRLEIDKLPAVQQELKSYRAELAEKYFINENELDRLLNEALERSDFEIKASHILVAVDELAQPADTLKAYNKALEIRSKLINGMSFEDAALKFSDDLSAENNKGNLGYFSVFKMVYPFESGAYTTKIGEISLPVRSNFGYHLIKVYNKRATPKVKNIAHILVEAKDMNDAEAKKKINEIYKRLEVGDTFYDVAFHFSEDIYSREKGGDLGIYNEGALNIEGISDIVYNLNFKGAYSKPFFSQYGWHIVSVTHIKDQPTKEELKENFLRKIKSDSRSKILERNLIHHLKEQYHFKTNHENIVKTSKLLNREELLNDPKVESNQETEMVLATYSDKKITAKNILEHIYSFANQYAFVKTDELLIEKAFDFYSLRKLKEEYNNNLEINFPDFAHHLNEYKEGLILFNFLEEKIWNESAKDTLALKNYFDEHQSNYLQPAYFIGEVYVFAKKSDAKTYNKLLNIKYPIKEADFPMVYKYQGRFSLDDKRLPKNLDLKTVGQKVIKYNNNYYVFYIRDRKETVQPTYEEVKSKVLSDYQNQFEQQYNEQLLKNARINLNETVLNQLKAKYNKKTLN